METFFASRIESEPIDRLECQKIFAESLDYSEIYKKLSRLDVKFFPYRGNIFFIGESDIVKNSLGLDSEPQSYEITFSDIDDFRIARSLIYSTIDKHLQEHGFALMSKWRQRRGKVAIYTGESRNGILFEHQIRDNVIVYDGICYRPFIDRLEGIIEIWIDPKVSALISLNSRELSLSRNWLITLCKNESCERYPYCNFLLKNVVRFKEFTESRFVDSCPIAEDAVVVNDEFFNEYTVPSAILFEESSSYNLRRRGCYYDVLRISQKWTDIRLKYLKTFLDILSDDKDKLVLEFSEQIHLNFDKNLKVLESENYDASKMY